MSDRGQKVGFFLMSKGLGEDHVAFEVSELGTTAEALAKGYSGDVSPYPSVEGVQIISKRRWSETDELVGYFVPDDLNPSSFHHWGEDEGEAWGKKVLIDIDETVRVAFSTHPLSSVVAMYS